MLLITPCPKIQKLLTRAPHIRESVKVLLIVFIWYEGNIPGTVLNRVFPFFGGDSAVWRGFYWSDEAGEEDGLVVDYLTPKLNILVLVFLLLHVD